MSIRKEARKHYFSVEGETEQWYLQWLQNTINTDPDTKYVVKLDCPIQKDPLKRAKGLVALDKTEITHVFDYESEEPVHVQQFTTTLNRMKEARNVGKSITYRLGYSNFTFELWIVLHKADCNGMLTHRSQYLAPINRAFAENFENLAQYKQEDNFKRVLSKLTLDNVRDAIRRSESIMQRNEENGLVLQQYKGYRYYKENPSLSIWKIIKEILEECGLL
jgi:hypothetical protein